MKRLILLIVGHVFFLSAFCQKICPIIPLPAQTKSIPGFFNLDDHDVIAINDLSMTPVARYLQKELLRTASLPLPIRNKYKGYLTPITLQYDSSLLSPGSYKLEISHSAVTINGHDNQSLFYGVISFLQLVECARATRKQVASLDLSITLNCWQIQDKPRYLWRGLMLDESRHFFGKEKVKEILRWMAFYKLNRFHWHLTDTDGWRVEIKRYPKLALIGGIGNRGDINAPACFYTETDIEEIVAYANERFITIIPEIDMPGHATAANRSYPEFSGGGSEKFPDFTFNPGNEDTYLYLANILKEVDVLFPSRMIHIGGDEVDYGNQDWHVNPTVKRLMRKNNLPDIKSVEYYFLNRMADSVIGFGNKVLAWDEAVDAGIPVEQSILFWWRQDKIKILEKAMEKGYRIVVSPRRPFYLSYSQDSLHIHGPFNGLQQNTARQIYDFAIDKISDKVKENQILGLQVNLWTEKIVTGQRLDFLLFPRIVALAENAWTTNKQKNYNDFKSRLLIHNYIYDRYHIYYYDLNAPLKNGEPIR